MQTMRFRGCRLYSSALYLLCRFFPDWFRRRCPQFQTPPPLQPPSSSRLSPGAEACRVRTYIKGLLPYLPSFPKATQTFLHLHLHLHLHLSALFNARTCNRSHRRDPSYSPLFTSFLLLLPSHRCLRVTAYSSSTSLHTSAIEPSHYKRKSCRPLLCCSATPVSCLDTLRLRITNYEY
jgi:hypothetical protein